MVPRLVDGILPMSKLKEFQPELVSTTLPLHLQKNPREVNYGNCMRWAYTAYHMFKKVELWDTDCHAFIKYEGKYYDSETLDGVNDWKELPTNRDDPYLGSYARKRSKRVFEKWWQNNNHIKPEWELYRSLAQDAVKKYASKGYGKGGGRFYQGG